jgi:4'-phosphopantetheinyl transferase
MRGTDHFDHRMNELRLPLHLPDHEAQVWKVHLPIDARASAEFQRTLDADERSRAARFRFEHDRNLFTTARGLLRSLIGRYCGIEAQEVRFNYGEQGKPGLATPARQISFNLSHSGDMVVLAFTSCSAVGVDVERCRADLATRQIASRFFADEEVEALFSLSADAQLTGFFRCWTRKEAFIKARGEGLSIPLSDFAVSLDPGKRARLIHIQGDIAAAERWKLKDIPVSAGYAAAVAVEDRECQISVRDWDTVQAAGRRAGT